jgi:DNA-binding Lrp family transcriptional regulator
MRSPSTPIESKISDQTGRILTILESSPDGMTAAQVGERLGVSVGNISSRLSKLVAYGIIERRRVKSHSGASFMSVYLTPSMGVSPANAGRSRGELD